MTSMGSPSVPARRSTRRAARNAATRIAEELAPQRRSTRLASLSDNSNGEEATSGGPTVVAATAAGGGGDSSPPASEVRRDVPRPACGGTKETPIVLDDDDSIDDMDLKPAAAGVVVAAAAVAAVVAAAERPPADFTCAICLDAPPCMSEVASISGCTHRFCFDCIDRWAETENRCPCCKARFQTIDRVVALPPSPAEAASETEAIAAGGGGRRGKRKRESLDSSPNARGARRSGGVGGIAPPDRRVNSRVVEDRNQQSATAFVVDAAMVHTILSSFMTSRGGVSRGGHITFGTSEEGRPQIRMIHPGNGNMVGILEMYLAGASPPGGVAVRGGGEAHTSSGGAGSDTGGVRVRISRAHRRSPARSSGSDSGARVTFAAVPAAGLSPLAPRSVERRSAINLATGIATGSAAAHPSAAGAPPAVGGSASGNLHPTNNAAAQQVHSAFASFLSSFRDSTERSTSSPPGGRASAETRAAMGAAAVASAASPPNRMTIRFLAHPTAATRGTSAVDSDGRHIGRSQPINRSPSMSSSGRSASGSSGDEVSGRGGSDEPIVID
ncbi:hypothetical protein ACHAW5_007292 [Stephanodiscus triporus]|uniref:RING-type E3 ubiquitin transferase n=1 Tax=Stephanodiscus triporus TaxID=2934178 RepID=A0ABD3NEA4_9STRA